MTRKTSRGYVIRLQCVGLCCATFNAHVEHVGDVSMSHVSDDKSEGYALYRDRALVKCPHCQGLCKLLPGTATIEVTKVE